MPHREHQPTGLVLLMGHLENTNMERMDNMVIVKVANTRHELTNGCVVRTNTARGSFNAKWILEDKNGERIAWADNMREAIEICAEHTGEAVR